MAISLIFILSASSHWCACVCMILYMCLYIYFFIPFSDNFVQRYSNSANSMNINIDLYDRFQLYSFDNFSKEKDVKFLYYISIRSIVVSFILNFLLEKKLFTR